MSLIRLPLALVCMALLIPSPVWGQRQDKPDSDAVLQVDKPAPDFELPTVDGKSIKLSELTEKSPVVVVVLRGYPGYQCPLCTRQVSDLVQSASKIAASKAKVLLIYPGPKKLVNDKAKEFFASAKLPAGFTVLLDPDYGFTDAYGLRWDAPNETAYPTTLIVGNDGIVRFASVSKSHGDRVSAKTVVSELAKLK